MLCQSDAQRFMKIKTRQNDLKCSGHAWSLWKYVFPGRTGEGMVLHAEVEAQTCAWGNGKESGMTVAQGRG